MSQSNLKFIVYLKNLIFLLSLFVSLSKDSTFRALHNQAKRYLSKSEVLRCYLIVSFSFDNWSWKELILLFTLALLDLRFESLQFKAIDLILIPLWHSWTDERSSSAGDSIIFFIELPFIVKTFCYVTLCVGIVKLQLM